MNPFTKFTEEELRTLAKALRQVDTWGLEMSVVSSLRKMVEDERDDRLGKRIDELSAAL